MKQLQLKRGTAERWTEVNPILANGEPGFVYDSNKLKIGDGVTPWNDLPYVSEGGVVNVSTRFDFPSVGNINTIYKAETEKMLYQWNPVTLAYEALNSAEGTDVSDIKLINGGNANGIY
jgi:hypothetical protein